MSPEGKLGAEREAIGAVIAFNGISCIIIFNDPRVTDVYWCRSLFLCICKSVRMHSKVLVQLT